MTLANDLGQTGPRDEWIRAMRDETTPTIGERARRVVRRAVPRPVLESRRRRIASRTELALLAADDLPFSGEGQLWVALIQHVDAYAEWGTGKSTVFALRAGCRSVVSVDTSSEWLERVTAISGSDRRFTAVQIDLGPVGKWGKPESYAARHAFGDYFEAPFRAGPSPELLLIDGRFRVACWASAMLNARPGTLIVFDDYVERGHYRIVEEIHRPVAVAGRQAVFVRPHAVDVDRLTTLLGEFWHVLD